jgi:23S rRNA pseudouridine1911/1915/1917 synthase
MKMVKPAITEYETLKHFIFEGNDFSLVRVHPKTGRTHQIRVHMAHIGHGLVGDPLYMKRKDPFHAKGQMLHAESVAFPLPEGGKARFEAPIGGDFARILEILTNK